ncbi:hypothetical protein Leryth_010788 [Lithospermum erythrorhizon]|nr:hypothetical protein Leryth_010788 [Lithospermum erythrorhizon]
MEHAEMAWVVHACLLKLGHEKNAFVCTALIDAYSICSNFGFAREVFDGIVEKDMVSWTGMVACYADNECFVEAVELFSYMRMAELKPNSFTFASVIKACIGLEAIHTGKSVHGCVLKTHYEMDPYVSTALLEMYTRSGDIKDARGVFNEIPKDDVIPWSFMIARYSQSDRCEEAIELFLDMRKALVLPNQFTFASVLQACASIEALKLGMQIHSFVLKVGLILDVFVSNALMDVYAKCGEMDESENIFMESENNNEVSWNTVIVGHVHSGDSSKALHIFMNMLENQVQPTEVTYSSVLRACASIAALEPGVQIHSLTIKSLYDLDAAVVNALIDMYAKCGSIRDARQVFEATNKQDVISWNAMISAYSMHGLGSEALQVFQEMRRLKIAPNQLTFVGVLSACSNTGSVDLGQDSFNLMQKNFGIEPCMEHYTCMVSLLGRRGHLDRALKLIDEIPYEPSVMVWRALLGACVAHKNIEVGIISAQRVLEMEPYDESAYVLLSNIYASTKRWDNVASIRKNMKKKRVKKEPGLSWIQYQGIVHYFTVGDCSHPDLRLINGMLEWLNKKTKSVGYTPNHDVILLDVEDDEKSRLLWVHSERLALAFALVRTPFGTPIRIIKNLRICMDCHAAMKLISNIVGREIIIRDINRFHHFADGSCSCGDYW